MNDISPDDIDEIEQFERDLFQWISQKAEEVHPGTAAFGLLSLGARVAKTHQRKDVSDNVLHEFIANALHCGLLEVYRSK